MAEKDNFDKRQYFEENIKGRFDELKLELNRARIPFVFVACLENDDTSTLNLTQTNVKSDPDDMRDENLFCDGITPGSMEIEVHNDTIKEIIKVLNGCKAAPSAAVMSGMDDFGSVADILEGRSDVICRIDNEMPVTSSGVHGYVNDYYDDDPQDALLPFDDEDERERRKEDQAYAESLGLTEPVFNISGIGVPLDEFLKEQEAPEKS